MSCDSWCDMVKVKEDLTGKVFDRLIVIKQVEDYIENIMHNGCANANAKNIRL